MTPHLLSVLEPKYENPLSNVAFNCKLRHYMQALYDVFVSSDCTMLEVNPLAETDTHELVAADAKVGRCSLTPGSRR